MCKDEAWHEIDEFEKLLQQFIDEGCEKVENDEDLDDDHEDDEPFDVDDDGDDDQLSDDDETNLDDCPEGSTHTADDDADDNLFPSGEIEQNLNLSVKVDILRPIANPREELDKLVGCTDIKRRLDELLSLTSFNKMMHEAYPDRKRHEVSLHSVFFGRPGTGKTTAYVSPAFDFH